MLEKHKLLLGEKELDKKCKVGVDFKEGAYVEYVLLPLPSTLAQLLLAIDFAAQADIAADGRKNTLTVWLGLEVGRAHHLIGYTVLQVKLRALWLSNGDFFNELALKHRLAVESHEEMQKEEDGAIKATYVADQHQSGV